MRRRRDTTGVTWLLILVLLPWPIDYWQNRERWRQDGRDDELFEKYDCSPLSRCAADFDGDGTPARLEVVPCEGRFYGCLVVLEGGGEVLRLKHDATDGTLRTHAAVAGGPWRPRLLIYDGASQRPPLRAAFEWDGERLARATPDAFEHEIINAMAAHDDSGGWNERTVFMDFIRLARFVAYYLLLLVLTCVLWAGRFYKAKPGPARAPHFLCRRQSL